jgi:hypothetical protein
MMVFNPAGSNGNASAVVLSQPATTDGSEDQANAVATPRPWYKDPILRVAMAIPLVAALGMGTYLWREQSIKTAFEEHVLALKVYADQTQAIGNLRDAVEAYAQVAVAAQRSSDPKVVEVVRLAKVEHDKLNFNMKKQEEARRLLADERVKQEQKELKMELKNRGWDQNLYEQMRGSVNGISRSRKISRSTNRSG